jgi:hypothetical protein
MLEYAPNGGDSRTEHYTYYGVEEVIIPPGESVLAVIAGIKLQHFVWKKSQFNEVKTENQCFWITNKGVLNFCFTNETTLKSITDNDNIFVNIGSVPIFDSKYPIIYPYNSLIKSYSIELLKSYIKM